jgi:hypothetical protein
MFNKALEVIETREFFGVDPDQIEVIIHPESLIHSMVGLSRWGDHGAYGRAGHAPFHRLCAELAGSGADLPVARLDLAQMATLTFRAPDLTRYPALRLAREVMARRGLAGAAFNAAKEVALDHFLAGGSASWTWPGRGRNDAGPAFGISAKALEKCDTLEDVLAMDHLARVRAAEIARGDGRKDRMNDFWRPLAARPGRWCSSSSRCRSSSSSTNTAITSSGAGRASMPRCSPRLWPGAVQPHRPARHQMAGRGDSLRRLREVPGRCRCGRSGPTAMGGLSARSGATRWRAPPFGPAGADGRGGAGGEFHPDLRASDAGWSWPWACPRRADGRQDARLAVRGESLQRGRRDPSIERGRLCRTGRVCHVTDDLKGKTDDGPMRCCARHGNGRSPGRIRLR